jgi:hypothetical protein
LCEGLIFLHAKKGGTMKYRVEVNNGSKYFADSEKAFFYYELKKQQPMTTVQMWKFVAPSTQILVAPTEVVCSAK